MVSVARRNAARRGPDRVEPSSRQQAALVPDLVGAFAELAANSQRQVPERVKFG
jgi:hypothetical protein